MCLETGGETEKKASGREMVEWYQDGESDYRPASLAHHLRTQQMASRIIQAVDRCVETRRYRLEYMTDWPSDGLVARLAGFRLGPARSPNREIGIGKERNGGKETLLLWK